MDRIPRLVAWPAGDVDGDGVPDLLVGFEKSDGSERENPLNRPLAAVVFGSALLNNSSGTHDLLVPPPLSQVDLMGFAHPVPRDMQATSGNFDGDRYSDIVLASAFGSDVQVVFGAAITAARASGYIDVSQSAPGDRLHIQHMVPGFYGGTKRSIGKFVAALPDVTGDGLDELIIGAGDLSDDFLSSTRTDTLVVSGEIIAQTRMSGSSELNTWDKEDYYILKLISPFDAYQKIAVGGDMDADGLSDIAFVKGRGGDTDRLGTIIFGSTVRSAILNETDISLDFSNPADGVNVELTSDREIDELPWYIATKGGHVGYIGGTSSVGFIPNLTDGAGDEVIFGREQYWPLGRMDAGAFFIIRDQAISRAQTPIITLSDDASVLAVGRKLQGIAFDSRLGGKLFLSDLDDDGIPDLSIASLHAGRAERPSWAKPGAYYMVPGTVLQRIFSDNVASYDLSLSIANETPPDLPLLEPAAVP